jgi:hypothetical protein
MGHGGGGASLKDSPEHGSGSLELCQNPKLSMLSGGTAELHDNPTILALEVSLLSAETTKDMLASDLR